jgi:uncharacterized protein (DUF4213/DUF364 family)
VKDPLELLYHKYGATPDDVKELICGKRYFALMLNNGKIGVCATLDQPYDVDANILKNPDFNNIAHRIVLNAYFNAVLNTPDKTYKKGDIFQAIDFKKYSNIVMIGFFRPLVKKFVKANISLSVFDKIEKESPVLPNELQAEYIAKSDALILTATTFFNGTFLDIIEKTNKCDIFILGPSAFLTDEIFDYKNIKTVFGSVFKKFDTEVLKIIQDGYGTRVFSVRADKVYIS